MKELINKLIKKDKKGSEELNKRLGYFLLSIGFVLWIVSIIEISMTSDLLKFNFSRMKLFSIFCIYLGIILILSYKRFQKQFLFKQLFHCCKQVLMPTGHDSNSLFLGIIAVLLGIVGLLKSFNIF